MAELTYREAVAAAIAQEMRRDKNVVFLGEDIAKEIKLVKFFDNKSTTRTIEKIQKL